MEKILNLQEFSLFRSRIAAEKGMEEATPCLVICAGTGGQASGSNLLARAIKRQILDRKLQGRLSLRMTGCQGFCQMDPFILVEPRMNLYPRITIEDVPRIIDAVLEETVVEELLYRDPESGAVYMHQGDIPFFKHQTRLILGMNSRMDPIRILDYLEQGGYAAFEKVMASPDHDRIIEEIERSGLRGRGGAGFSTGRKWRRARAAGRGESLRYVVCNADEGDPGAYMDRSILEGNPHAVIEGLVIAGVATGATRGIVYVRAEYPLAIKHATIAIRQARDLGILGADILGTGIDFDIDIVHGAGAFVCGEETALIRSIEGYMGEPRQRPPYPVERGIDGHPTCINNVETLANVPTIIDGGADAYARIGVPGNRGTKIFSLVGKIRNTGLVEVPFGTTIREVVHHIGGGASGDAPIKAVQTGGPSGGCIPASMFDLPIDYESLKEAGSIVGSGGMIVLDETTCMVDLARYFMGFLKDESCGKCFPCRKGTQRMYELLEDITEGRGTPEHLTLIEELAEVVRDSTMCGLGQTAANPVLSTLRHFRDEYERHVIDKRCDAFVCKNLVGAPCAAACPVGTEPWRYIAHIGRSEYEEAYRVIRQSNPFPSVCARVCNHPCEQRCRAGASGGEPVSIRALKRFVTDLVPPSAYAPPRIEEDRKETVAVVGAGPAGLTAAHDLSLRGYRVTLFEADARPGGMLVSCIPAYRLPRDVLKAEIASLMNDRIRLVPNTSLGKDFTVESLFSQGYGAVFLALGAHRSRPMGIAGEGEATAGVYTGMLFLKSFNLEGASLARGRVGVIGGGNSAVDAARVAIRQESVESVTILYRRTRKDMPAFREEIDAASEEGVRIRPLLAPVRILSKDGVLTGVECVKNRQGEPDASGRRRPLAVPGTEHVILLDTLIVSIGEEPTTDFSGDAGIGTARGGTVSVDPDTLATDRPGVFAGGDLVTGPNTVIHAVAAGRRAAFAIERYLEGLPMKQPARVSLPEVYVEPPPSGMPEKDAGRAEPPVLSPADRVHAMHEVEGALTEPQARHEALRCLRCDLEFTRPVEDEPCDAASGGTS